MSVIFTTGTIRAHRTSFPQRLKPREVAGGILDGLKPVPFKLIGAFVVFETKIYESQRK
jgi:hypothetical protein